MKSKLKVVAIIQARINSSRLPGKVLETIVEEGGRGYNSLEIMVRTLSDIPEISETVIAVPVTDTFKFTGNVGAADVLGSSCAEENVYLRVMNAAYIHNADVVVDLTGDCPFISGYELRKMLRKFLRRARRNKYLYMSNVFPQRLVPDGMDVQIYTLDAMQYVYNHQMECFCSQHTGWNIWKHEQGFYPGVVEYLPYGGIPALRALSGKRITLDTPEDLETLRNLARVFPFERSLNRGFVDMRLLATKKGLGMLVGALRYMPEELWVNAGVVGKEPGNG